MTEIINEIAINPNELKEDYATCPSDSLLREYASLNLADKEHYIVEEHLDICIFCHDRYEKLSILL